MSNKKLPKLVVFDLDWTLWPFHVDTNVDPPFHKKNGIIYDRRGAKIKCCPETPKVLETVKDLGIDMALASRTSEIAGAKQLVELFGWDPYFKYKEIYPGCKKTHFQRFQKLSNIDYKDMLFFDDESRNIRDLNEYKVTSIFVKNGMNMEVLQEGLRKHQEKNP